VLVVLLMIAFSSAASTSLRRRCGMIARRERTDGVVGLAAIASTCTALSTLPAEDRRGPWDRHVLLHALK